jgi:hypothetical protein
MLIHIFTSVCIIEEPDPPLYPVIFPELALAVQVNIVPVTLDVRWMLVVMSLQMDCDSGYVVRTGMGFTVTFFTVGEGHG